MLSKHGPAGLRIPDLASWSLKLNGTIHVNQSQAAKRNLRRLINGQRNLQILEKHACTIATS